ncbi:glycine dehydrogenase (decarboxylating) [Rubidibacter lacunae KORDI 51-2]|uniref:Glycine dehydrogenase (decarboxylating) n=1 Tax=Rubidibacter lacunae KORDI 51-2 TaxID=582515 RepID=U5DPL0_9CHRO|nr:aminomethyl-transferring glycine dehydrogenase [Rubidibacter lacunae]ERN41620.1 glycine dehydrogenase (decarboxylating) [Rubidibacter lacunae KORDI 51-2]
MLNLTPAPAANAPQSSDINALLGLGDSFVPRHVGPDTGAVEEMLKALGYSALDALIDDAVPAAIRMPRPLKLPPARSERAALNDLQTIAQQNQVFRSYIGMGYYDCITPGVILRNILENPGWYTAYTPYQAEIAQGRLEALLNFQTLVMDLTGMEIANASLLDEGTAAAEAMSLSLGVAKSKANTYFVAADCHPQTIEVVRTRALPLGIEVVVGDWRACDFSTPIFGALLQYPTTDGKVCDYRAFVEQAHAIKAIVTVAADPLSLALLTPPGEFGADIAVGSLQRFGVPMGYGGPHAAYFATRNLYQRRIPGRVVGVSHDAQGRPALRLALQTREQHIRRDKATSNICTAQVLLAVMASMYAVYHGPEGIKRIAARVHRLTALLASGLRRLGYDLGNEPFFDTLCVTIAPDSPQSSAEAVHATASERRINLRHYNDKAIGVALDETATMEDAIHLLQIFAGTDNLPFAIADLRANAEYEYTAPFARTSEYLSAPVFNSYHSETELLRYIFHLQGKDITLATSMIPLGSCTMKLNATAEMLPVSWAEFGKLHPFAPKSQTRGYQILFEQLEAWLAEITGFAAISLQPNAGSQGEYAGLQVIRKYHEARGESQRIICLIPESAHGTNPASAVMCGMKVVAIACDERGDVDLDDLTAKAEKHKDNLAALMVTYPSTHGVFEVHIRDICKVVHARGGQVYMDGANTNAQVGLCRPGDFGADVCHLNLHKTFCIPHGGGGPGMGPIGVAAHLVPYLPGHGVVGTGSADSIGAISAAPWGSASILPISWMYIAMMGAEGLTQATKVAILSANYVARRLDTYYPVLFRGDKGLVAHECVVDLRPLKKRAGIEVDDVAKRLMDFGYHAPTVSWPVPGTMMVEPTESETKAELDRFCEAMIAIRKEVEAIENGRADPNDNVLKHAPHPAAVVVADAWERPYTREQAAYPAEWVRDRKFWPSVGRVDNAYGDRNLICSCIGMDAYKDD